MNKISKQKVEYSNNRFLFFFSLIITLLLSSVLFFKEEVRIHGAEFKTGDLSFFGFVEQSLLETNPVFPILLAVSLFVLGFSTVKLLSYFFKKLKSQHEIEASTVLNAN